VCGNLNRLAQKIAKLEIPNIAKIARAASGVNILKI